MSDNLKQLLIPYKDVLQGIREKQNNSNFLVIEFNYSRIILPHTEGIAFINALANVEQLHSPYEKRPSIGAMERTAISTTFMSREEYEDIKVANLLDITIDEAKQLRKHSIEPDKPKEK